MSPARCHRDDPRRIVYRPDQGPTDGERAALLAARAGLEAWLTPADDAEIGALVMPVLTTMKGRDAGEMMPFVSAGYLAGLAGLPGHAVAAACQQVLAGEAVVDGRRLDLAFRPTPAELAALARSLAIPTRAEIHEIDLVLEAVEEAAPPDEAERDRTIARLSDFMSRGRAAQRAVDRLTRPPDPHEAREARRSEARERKARVEEGLAGCNFPPVGDAKNAKGETG